MPPSTRNKPPGRSPLPAGKANNISYPVSLSEELLDRLKANKEKTDKPVATQIRKAIESYLDRGIEDEIDNPPYTVHCRYLANVPAGPWNLAIENAGYFALSENEADYLQADADDVLVGIRGESMEGRGVPDGAYLLMRPLSELKTPRRGDVVLVQCWNEEGVYQSTIKEWRGMHNNLPLLVDGAGRVFEFPGDTIGFRAVATFQGLITDRLPQSVALAADVDPQTQKLLDLLNSQPQLKQELQQELTTIHELSALLALAQERRRGIQRLYLKERQALEKEEEQLKEDEPSGRKGKKVA